MNRCSMSMKPTLLFAVLLVMPALLPAAPRTWTSNGGKSPQGDLVAVKAAGGTLINYTELEGHGITGAVYPRPELHQWLFAQRRKSAQP